MSSCTFCRVVNGELPSQKIYEDGSALAFLDINPIRKGHTLIVPKKHHKDFLDIPAEELAYLSKLVQILASSILKATGANAFNIIGNNGASAGQIIFHTHLHLIPRKAGDPRIKFSETFSWSQGREGDKDLASTAAAIRAELSKEHAIHSQR